MSSSAWCQEHLGCSMHETSERSGGREGQNTSLSGMSGPQVMCKWYHDDWCCWGECGTLSSSQVQAQALGRACTLDLHSNQNTQFCKVAAFHAVLSKLCRLEGTHPSSFAALCLHELPLAAGCAVTCVSGPRTGGAAGCAEHGTSGGSIAAAIACLLCSGGRAASFELSGSL